MKRFLSFILSLTIMISAFPINALVVSADEFSSAEITSVSKDTDKDSDIKNNDDSDADNDKKHNSDSKDIDVKEDDTKVKDVDKDKENDTDTKDSDKETDKGKSKDKDIAEDQTKDKEIQDDKDANLESSKHIEDAELDIEYAFFAKSYNLKFGQPVGVENKDKNEINKILAKYKGNKYTEGTQILEYLPDFNEVKNYEFEGWYILTGKGKNQHEEKMPDDFQMPASDVRLIPYFKIAEIDETKVNKEITVKVGETLYVEEDVRFLNLFYAKSRDTQIADAKESGWIIEGYYLKVTGKQVGVTYVDVRKNREDLIYKVTVIPADPIVVDAKYYVLLPDYTINNLGAEEAWQYVPNNSIKIGSWNANTGIPGKLYSTSGVVEAGYEGLRDYDGFGSEYVKNPDEMGEVTYKGIHYDLNSHDIAWYKIKYHKSEKAYHVDGFIKDLPAEVVYQWNGKKVSYISDDHSDGKVRTGDEITLVDNDYTKFENGTKVFDGWKVIIGGEETIKQSGTKITVMNSMIIEPVWKDPIIPIEKTSITYKYENKEVTDETIVGNKYVAKTFESAFPSIVLPENKEFIGWKIAQGSEVITDNLATDGSIIVNNNSNKVVLEAVIKEIPTENIEICVGETKTIKSNETFNLIDVKSNEVTATSIDESSFSMVGVKEGTTQAILKQNDKVVAIYNVIVRPKPIVAYKVMYASSVQGAKDMPTESPLVNEGSKIILPVKNPSADGYEFIGWFDGKIKVSNESIMPSHDLTLTAEFNKKSYSLGFKAVDKDSQKELTGVSNLPANQTVEYASLIQDIVKNSSPSKDGYKFLGWFDEAGNKLSNETKMPAKDITLTAKFEKVSYGISYKAIDVMDMQTSLTGVTKLPTAKETTFGASINDIVKDVVPEKYGYNFLYWRYNGSAITNQTVPSNNIELVAHFERSLFNVNYSYEGVAQEDKDNIKNFPQNAKDIAKGTEITLDNQTLNGYHFLGWFDEQGNKVNKITVNKDYNLTAKFAKDATIEYVFYSLESGQPHKDTVVIDTDKTYEGAKYPVTAENIKTVAEKHLADNKINNFRYLGEFQALKDGEPIYYSKDIENSQVKNFADLKLSAGKNTIYVLYDMAHNITVNYIQIDGETQTQLGNYQINDVFNQSEVAIKDGYENNAGFISNNYLLADGYKLIKATLGDYENGTAIPNPFTMGKDNEVINVFYAKDDNQWKDINVEHIYNSDRNIETSTVSVSESKVVNQNYEATPILTNNNVKYILSSVTVNGVNVQLVDGKITGTITDNVNIIFTYDVDKNGDGVADKNQATFIFKSADEKMGKVVGDVTQIVTNENGKTYKVTSNVTTIVEAGYKFSNWTAEVQGKVLKFENLDAIKASEFLGDVTFTANFEAVLSGGGGSSRPHRPSRPSTDSSGDNTTGGTPIEVIEIPELPTPLEQNPVITIANPYIPSQQTTDVIVDIEDEDTPLAEKPEDDSDLELIEIEDETVPLTSSPVSGWALVNLIMTVFTVISSIILLLKNKNMFKTLSIFPAIGSVIAFILTENITNPMVITDKWTLMMCIIALIQVVVIALSAKGKKDEDTQSDAK